MYNKNFKRPNRNNGRPVSRVNKNEENETKVAKGFPSFIAKFPPHVVAISVILRNNSAIRRLTSLGIINWLKQHDIIKGDKNWVNFKWEKFTVTSEGMARDYLYTEKFFLINFLASFNAFVSISVDTVKHFVSVESADGPTINEQEAACQEIINYAKENTKEIISEDE